MATRRLVGPPAGLTTSSVPSNAWTRSRSPASPPPGEMAAFPTPSSRTSTNSQPGCARRRRVTDPGFAVGRAWGRMRAVPLPG